MPCRDDTNQPLCLLTRQEQHSLPKTTRQDRIKELKGRFSQIWFSKLGGDPRKIETECDISSDYFYRMTKRSEGRNIKRHHVLQLSIGARLDEDEARELLYMLGEPLDEQHSRLDYIFLCNLRHRASLDEFKRDLSEYGLSLK